MGVVSRILAAVPFDCNSYLARYKDLRIAYGFDCKQARAHWSQSGQNEGRDGSHDPNLANKMRFDCYSYLGRYTDLRRGYGVDCGAAQKHFIESGIDEGRDGSFDQGISSGYANTYNAFDCRYYLAKYADLRGAFGGNCAAAQAHWTNSGFKELREAAYPFDCYSYLARHDDLRRAFGGDCNAATNHWYNSGVAEGRNGAMDGALHNKIAQFNCGNYFARYADLRNGFGSDCNRARDHYIRYGMSEGRDASL